MIINIEKLKDYILNNFIYVNEEIVDKLVNNLKGELVKNHYDLNNLNIDSKKTSIDFIGDDIVIRLMFLGREYSDYKSISDYISHSRIILKPLFEKKYSIDEENYITLLGLKRLNTGQISDLDQKVCYIKLRLDGYLFNGANNKENFGKDENGEVYLINYDNLIYINDNKKFNSNEISEKNEYQNYVKRQLEKHVSVCKDLNEEYLKYLEFASEFAFNAFKENQEGNKKK